MANVFGPNDLKQWALPAGWDAARLMQLQLSSGETYEQLVSDIASALSIGNAGLLGNPLIASLVGVTDEMTVEYPVGVSNTMEDHTEYGRPTPTRGKTTGHMLELFQKDGSLAWTWDFLRVARRSQIDNDINTQIAMIANTWEKMILTRFFKNTYTAVGTSGKSMPFADGGTADSTYIPAQRPDRASAFAYTHTHYNRLDSITQANLETTVAHLWEHGYDPPYTLLASQADMASWSNTTNVTGFVKPGVPGIRYGTQTDLAEVGAENGGVIETAYGSVLIRYSARIPTLWYAVYKSFGPLDSRNPIKVMGSPQFGLGAILLAGDHIRQFPLEQAQTFFEGYLGIGDRTAAAHVHSGGAWSIPTIS
jgi:hypothetical protein